MLEEITGLELVVAAAAVAEVGCVDDATDSGIVDLGADDDVDDLVEEEDTAPAIALAEP